MRYKGKIITWNDDRGFGFIEQIGGNEKLFAHISSFAERKRRPSVGDIVTYEAVKDERGRSKAQKIALPGAGNRKTVIKRTRLFPWATFSTVSLIAILSIGASLLYASKVMFTNHGPSAYRSATAETSFRCEGKKHCSQMSSCAEAKFYLNNCPGTIMDGDGDGVPCESQWCGR
jgi:cold shock CspA family protein